MGKDKQESKVTITHVLRDGTMVDSVAGLVIPQDSGYYLVLSRIAARLQRERTMEEVTTS